MWKENIKLIGDVIPSCHLTPTFSSLWALKGTYYNQYEIGSKNHADCLVWQNLTSFVYIISLVSSVLYLLRIFNVWQRVFLNVWEGISKGQDSLSHKNRYLERNNKQTLGTPTGLTISQSFKEVLGIQNSYLFNYVTTSTNLFEQSNKWQLHTSIDGNIFTLRI